MKAQKHSCDVVVGILLDIFRADKLKMGYRVPSVFHTGGILAVGYSFDCTSGRTISYTVEMHIHPISVGKFHNLRNSDGIGTASQPVGRAKDNIWIERFWKTIKYEYIYIQPEENGADLFYGIRRFIDDYNYHCRHQGINRTVPSILNIRQVAWS